MHAIAAMPVRWKISLAIALGLIAFAAGIGVALWERPQPNAAALMALSLPDLDGRTQPLNQWKGKVLVINFWATWCAPCREEMPEFVRAQKELGAKGLQFVGIAVDRPDLVEQFVDELHLNYPALIGGYEAVDLSRSLGNRLSALPFTVVLDRQGRIAHIQLGPLRRDKLRSIVDNLL